MARLLSLPDKRKIIELLIERDEGFHCFYCKIPLTQKTGKIEHLDNDNEDNRLDNLVLTCQSCNIKKVTDDKLQEIALEKLDKNEEGIFVGEKFLESLTSKEQKQNEVSKEIEINGRNYDIAIKFIQETVDREGFVLFSDALNSIVYLCKKNTNHGSHQSVRNYLLTITSSVAPFEITRNTKNKKIIVKRVLSQ